MIIKIKHEASEVQIEQLKNWIKSQGLSIYFSEGEHNSILGLIGDTSQVDESLINALEIVENVVRIQEPYKKVNRKFHPEDTVITLENGTKIGGGNFVIMAGPCSVETEEQVIETAKHVKASGANVLRGGAFKPRSSPYSFQGLGAKGIEILLKAKEVTGLPIVTEIMEPKQIIYFEHVDIIQVGARNMQNFELLKVLGAVDKPILLKRGLSATYEELLMSAEYIMAGGNSEVMLCERGIRTFEKATRNTFDVTAIPYLKSVTHLPIIADPSHAAGMHKMVKPLSLAATAAGVDGLLIEVHNDPERALCDGPQSLKPEKFDDTAKAIFKIREILSEV
ncbi:3-deoxy-7-phosphoheptulonate synthase [Microaceticoccus formicicus]|uniref:3-deoxy-7-phosphoheptulonate synthase n=1 Tax=Microaceticoccus formicicus TaxID=3118105 RepID=UPI003CD0367D|nr:3-deoxy-7-phosphoheptulonate synthase [Peptoniphilaceae bacterium AMB_02]